jgi:hypothetical protein
MYATKQSAISATWKDKHISVFDRTKPDADVAKIARNAIKDIQQHSLINAYWVEGHADKCTYPPFSPQEELNILTYGLAGRSQTYLPTEMKPRSDCLHFPEKVYIVIQ